jgi:A/G-specific adenine glycosylase
VKTKKINKKTRYLHYFLQDARGRQWVKKRPPGDIWAGLYEFPTKEMNIKAKKISDIFSDEGNILPGIQSIHTVKPLLTHQVLYIHFWKTTLDPEKMRKEGYIEKTQEELHQLSFPRPLRGIFEKL